MKDAIVEEVRANRMAHTEKFKGDLDAICADLNASQYAAGRDGIRLTPRKIEHKPALLSRRKKHG